MKTITITIIAIFLIINCAKGQDELYIYKAGTLLYKQALSNIDSITFSNTTQEAETVTDIDGNVYHTVTIGTQVWMVENLKTTKYHNGNGGTIPNITASITWRNSFSGAYCNYNNDEAFGLKYGRLYNWYAVFDAQKLAPIGWHVATDADWTKLINYLIVNGYNYDGTRNDNRVAKSLAANTDWTTFIGPGAVGNDLTKNNSSGFTALPGGARLNIYDPKYENIGVSSYWWSATAESSNNAFSRSLSHNSSYAYRTSDSKENGFYVRCVKD